MQYKLVKRVCCVTGDVEVLPEGSHGNLPDLNSFRIRPTAHEPDPYSSASSSGRVTFEGLPAPAADAEVRAAGHSLHCVVLAF